MIIDTHSHVNFKAFSKDADQTIKRTLAENVWMINVGTKLETSQKAVELAEKYSQGVFTAIGLHPIYTTSDLIKIRTDPDEGAFLIKDQGFDRGKYQKMAESKKVVAVGEIGLDYYYRPKTSLKLAQFKEKQKKVFLEQLDFAKEVNLPLIIHCRVAHEDMIEILSQRPEAKGVIHCFTGSLEQAEKYIRLGFYIGINGIIFKLNLDQIIKNISLNNILVETDCPYLTPPMAENKRNEPIFIKYTIRKTAELKNVSFEEVCKKTTENAKNLFKI